MTNWRRWWILGSFAIAIALPAITVASGFQGVNVSESGDTLVYRPSVWWMVVFLVSGLAMLVASVVVMTLPHVLLRLVGCFALVGGLVVVVIAPTAATGSLVVTNKGFEHTVGFWWRPETVSVEFDSLVSMKILHYRHDNGLPAFNLECLHKDGQRVTIPGSDLLKAGLAHVSVRAVIHNVPVSTRDDDKR